MIGMGDLLFDVLNSAESMKVTLHDVLHTPDMGLTIVSISCIVKLGCSVEFEDSLCKIKRRQKVIGKVPASANRLYKVEQALAAMLPEYVDILTLHCRLGHISVDTTFTLVHSNAVTGVHLIDNFPPLTCDSCEYAKATCKAICKEREAPQADFFGAEVHSDVWGPSPTQSLGSCKYDITFTDNCTHFTCLEVLQMKDETLSGLGENTTWHGHQTT